MLVAWETSAASRTEPPIRKRGGEGRRWKRWAGLGGPFPRRLALCCSTSHLGALRGVGAVGQVIAPTLEGIPGQREVQNPQSQPSHPSRSQPSSQPTHTPFPTQPLRSRSSLPARVSCFQEYERARTNEVITRRPCLSVRQSVLPITLVVCFLSLFPATSCLALHTASAFCSSQLLHFALAQSCEARLLSAHTLTHRTASRLPIRPLSPDPLNKHKYRQGWHGLCCTRLNLQDAVRNSGRDEPNAAAGDQS